jgi:hypothetical protein
MSAAACHTRTPLLAGSGRLRLGASNWAEVVVLVMTAAHAGSGSAATKTETKRGPTSTESKRGPNGGVTVKVGPYLGEFRVWEKFVELFIYDDAGKPVSGKDLKGTLEVLPKSAAKPS